MKYGLDKWGDQIPKGVINHFKVDKDIDISKIEIDDFFDELYLLDLKEIGIYSDHYNHLRCLTGDLSKDKFIELMDELNLIRRKVGHAKRTYTKLDLSRAIDIIKQICQTDITKDLIQYINNESYKSAKEIPASFFKELKIPNNLPTEDYALDGGFVGRKKEVEKIKKFLYSDQDRIITITGAGGVGKTAVALKVLYEILYDPNKPFDAIIWFSAKETKLTADYGIIQIEPVIKNFDMLVKDILSIVDIRAFQSFEESKIPIAKYVERLYGIFSSQKCLLVIDNLETIKDGKTTNFIKDIPRPSKVLITSRKGLGEIERRYSLPDFAENDAVDLFRRISRERTRIDLLRLPDETIKKLVNKVECYPLVIKWSIGKVCLGKPIEDAFSEIHSGKSEIAKFAFMDVFELLIPPAKLCLFSMIVFGDQPISQHMLMHLANLDSDTFEDGIKELMITSFVIQETSATEEEVESNYSILSLTRGYVRSMLDEDKKTFNAIQTRLHDLSRQIELGEKVQKALHQSFTSLGIKTDEEKIAYNYVKTAKNFLTKQDYDNVEKNFKQAINIAPNFGYALIEFAKFEFYRGHTGPSNTLFKKAIKVDPENFLVFFSFGICLRKQNRSPEAIQMFEKALELNPEYLPIYNELGRVHTFIGDYEKADGLFQKAKQQKGPPNYKHKFITLQYQANNYKRWAEDFFKRKDDPKGILKLNRALSTIEEADQVIKGDKNSLIGGKNICLDIALYFCKSGEFNEAAPYFERCLKKIELSDGRVLSMDREMAKAHYYFAYYAFKLDARPKETIKEHIKTGLAITGDLRLREKISRLENKFNIKHGIKPTGLKMGVIKYFNTPRKYGIIKYGTETVLFFLTGFDHRLLEDEILTLDGKKVSFTLTNNPLKKDSKLAVNIHLEED